MYSETDPDSSVGVVLLKTQFVAKSWEDILKKLEKIEGWQEEELQDLLREVQKVYMRRDEEKQKVQVKVAVGSSGEGSTETGMGPRPCKASAGLSTSEEAETLPK